MKAHGPVQRDFSFKLNKKIRALGVRVCVSAKAREGCVYVCESLKMKEAKTAVLAAGCVRKGWGGKKVLFLDGEYID
jgi:large subunit ribosomal protein L4